MSRSTGILSLLRSDDKAYDVDYIAQEKKRRRMTPTRQQTILILAILFISVILYKVLVLNQPTLKYDRKLDAQLINYIYQSQAARELPRKGKLFCWVQTAEIFHGSRARAINETWLSRCDHGQLFTSALFKDDRIPYSTVFAGIPESYYNLFYKSRYAFYHAWTHISNEFDWYMKADDDTYVVVEHLNDYLSTLDPNKPYYLGYILRPYLENGYNAGGAGYVLSREALRQFVEKAYRNETICPDDIYEDVGIGRCMANLGIFPHDTRNEKGQNRFYTYTPSDAFHAVNAFSEYTWFPEKAGFDAFARDMISFHHLSPDEIRLFDILLYRTNRP